MLASSHPELDGQVKIGVLASHEGTTLQAIIDACATGALRARVVTVISNNRDAAALQRARAAGITTHQLSSQTHPRAEVLDAAICEALAEAGVDVVILAGYMKQLGPVTLARFRGRVLNTNPALLPKFGGKGMYGLNVHRAVLAAHEPITGVSVHLVAEAYDAGPVIAQRESWWRRPIHRKCSPCGSKRRNVLADIAEGRLRLPQEPDDGGRPTDRFSGPAAPTAER